MTLDPPGDDVGPTPAPVDEEPPHDRFCDLVLTGGLASGVVYPWAVVELARAFRFRNIGGSSVGAMAAALAAAAEYGRRTGFATPFEVLRRLPGALGTDLPEGRTRMLSLFQPRPAGRRLLGLWAQLFQQAPADGSGKLKQPRRASRGVRAVAKVLRAYFVPCGLGAIVGALLGWGLTFPPDLRAIAVVVLLGIGFAGVALLLAILWDVQCGLIANNLGLCKGGTLEPQDPDHPRPGLTEWLHQGIQRSAGLKLTDAPLTFRDLWNAPAHPGAPAKPCSEADPPGQRAINLQMITTNVTHGRPYRLPLADQTSRLFFRPGELKPYLPRAVLRALMAAAPPYAPLFPGSDPPADSRTRKFRQLPGADMPVVVAARLSLSFPLLFSAVPLYAIDYDRKPILQRTLKRCLFTDGGVSSNFPIHIFDAALPRWPTFGLWLDRSGPHQELDDDAPVWLPELHQQGRADAWNRFQGKSFGLLFGFLGALLSSAKDWQDRSAFRMPHVRNRVARLWLRKGEGGLNIGMPRQLILRMAHRYGTTAGRLFVQRFGGDVESVAWSEHRWIRLQLLISSLRERLGGLSSCAAHASYAVPIREAIDAAENDQPPLGRGSRNLTKAQAKSLRDLLGELEDLEGRLRAAVAQDYKPLPEPELRLRAPL